MRLKELIEGVYNPQKKFVEKANVKAYDPVEVKSAIDKLVKTKEFKDITSTLPLISTPQQLKNGTIVLSVPDSESDYKIDVEGNVRSSSKKGQVRLTVPEPDEDLVTRYINCLKEVEKKFSKRTIAEDKSWNWEKKGFGKNEIQSLSDLDLSMVSKSLDVSFQSLSDLLGCPTKLSALYIIGNSKPLSLKGCPKIVSRVLSLRDNKLLDINHLPSLVETMYLDNTDITNLKGIGRDYIKSAQYISLVNCPDLKSNILGLLSVKNLEHLASHTSFKPDANVELDSVIRIIRKHLETKDILECQEELIEAGFKEFAKL
jgi:hypothetical protein